MSDPSAASAGVELPAAPSGARDTAWVWSATLQGVAGHPIRVEVDARNVGLPSFQTVGLPDGAVREGKDRIRAAIINSGYPFPNGRVTVNLAPADLRKDGTALDLPIAVALLAARGEIPETRLDQHLIVGELGLDGSIRPVRGALCLAAAAHQSSLVNVIVPAENAVEAAFVEGIRVLAAHDLREVAAHLAGVAELTHVSRSATVLEDLTRPRAPDLTRVRGQAAAKRALTIAAAGKRLARR